MSDATLRDVARRAGIAVEWTDHVGKQHRVSVAVLRRILAALGLPSGHVGEMRESQAALRATCGKDKARLITAQVGEAVAIANAHAAPGSPARLIYEDGTRADLRPRRSSGGRWVLPPVATPGYHRLEIGARVIDLAVAPVRCCSVEDLAPGARLWGLAAQLYGLRRAGDGGIGDTGALAALARAAARHGADALALSPAHALFTADPTRYSPYAPSSRLFLNPLYADPACLFGGEAVARATAATGLAPEFARLEAAPLIDWPAAARAKLALLRRLFDDFVPAAGADRTDALGGDFAKFRADGGDLLRRHARFEALHAARMTSDGAAGSWRGWPATWRDPSSAAVEDFSARHARDVLFHTFLQWVADRTFATAHAAARGAGMRIGLIADLAVGMDSGGSHAWSCQRDLLVGLEVGAPPDDFNPLGQNWGLTAFSPRALAASGFAPFISTLRAVMRNAGGVRIDHVMGLRRLWLVPEGAPPGEGAYLAYPLDDLLRLVALESHRHRAVVIGEDLGTVPAGFRKRLAQAGVAGMRVLWFERDARRFRPPQAWPEQAVAMTTTHDLPTVAGWWRGADIDTRAKLGVLGEPPAQARRARTTDRAALWRALRAAGAAAGAQPGTQHPQPVADAAAGFIARTPARLALLPLEDALGSVEQPNVPGTIDEHPNWRRRTAQPADHVLDPPEVCARLAVVDRNRRS
jgi:4-alpha-glucanotransferase